MTRYKTILGIETSCDETAAAIVRAPVGENGAINGQGSIVSNVVLSQIDMHAPYGGVVPELAARAHLSQLDRLIEQALSEAEIRLDEIDAVAATSGPGLIGGVLIGLTTGKALALAANKPFIGVNHLEGHALTVRMTDATAFPYLLLLVSGGHCQLISVNGLADYHCFGTTRDDAVGEAFDKAAKLLRLGYPGGPEIEARAVTGDPSQFNLPRPLLRSSDPSTVFDFSFSGLKTALRQQAENLQPLSQQNIDDLAASFQAAVLDCLADRSANAMRQFRQLHPLKGAKGEPLSFVIAGGVAANAALRQRLDELSAQMNFAVHVAPPALCTDNAAMIAWAGAERLVAGEIADHPMAEPARARWPLAELRRRET
jgi:N6-L-threonylcarbamoyladenine synthase